MIFPNILGGRFAENFATFWCIEYIASYNGLSESQGTKNIVNSFKFSFWDIFSNLFNELRRLTGIKRYSDLMALC